MDPNVFPDPQGGMVVESTKADGDTIRVRTTGAEIALDASAGSVTFRQRIGHPRPLVALNLGRPLEGIEITHARKGLARLAVRKPKLTIRVNGDSLFMLHAHEPLTASVENKIAPAWHATYGANHLLADEWGALGLYCSEPRLDDHWDPYRPRVAEYALPGNAVLWVGVCPPKPYDWRRSFEDNIVWHWSNQLGYPPDDVLRSWRPYGNIVLLQSEVMLWKQWNLGFEPRLGRDEFARVRKTLHDLGMRFIVYTSPYYFLKGTKLEPRAFGSFEGFTGWPPGTSTGENMHLFLPEIRKVMRELKPDGLYFDGQYVYSPAALYALARHAREIVGEDGILEWHSTLAMGGDHCYLPHADAYVDFILRGEGRQKRYSDFDYMRFFISGYNIHNSIGVVCNNGKVGLPRVLVRDALRVNARFHLIANWLDDPNIVRVWKEEYRPKLTPDLRKRVDALTDRRQAEADAKVAKRHAEHEALVKPPSWDPPLLALEFDTLPDAKPHISPANKKPFAVADGSLKIRAHGNTYAYIAIPLGKKAEGFVVKLRQGTEEGQSWGPGAMLRWSDGSGIRIGTRSDGMLQSDVHGKQTVGGTYDTKKWVWLRARWLEQSGVIERSDDGKTYRRLWTFEHFGELTKPAVEVFVGKVPYDGEPRDYAVHGEVGECEFDFVRVFGE